MNNNENKENKDQEQQFGTEGNTRGNAPQTSSKSPFAKRWTFPVIYLAASVLIVGLMYAKSQDAAPYEIDKTGNDLGQTAGPTLPEATGEEAAPTNATPSLYWPVGAGGEDAQVSMDFYRDNGTDAEKEAALVVFENNYIPSQGINIGLKSDASFEVIAAAKGTVIDVKEDPLMGQTVEIDHGNGYTTYYASLSAVEVKKGSIVLQGQPIAKTGNNRFEKEQQNHLHFEVRKDGTAIDPNSLLPKKNATNAKSTQSDLEQGTTPSSAVPNGSIEPSSTLPSPNPIDDRPVAGDEAKTENKDQTPAGDAKSTTKPAEKSTETTPSGDAAKEDASTSTDATSGAR